ncbi:MAG: chlorophyll a/b-binding protein [Prochlorococcus sp.]
MSFTKLSRAELLHGRFAMAGLLSLVLIELIKTR